MLHHLHRHMKTHNLLPSCCVLQTLVLDGLDSDVSVQFIPFSADVVLLFQP